MYLITMYGVPFVILTSLNWRIGREIHLARIRRKKMTMYVSSKKIEPSMAFERAFAEPLRKVPRIKVVQF